MPNRQILDSDEQDLKIRLDEMCKYASNALQRSIQSLQTYDADIAKRVISEDDIINTIQYKIEELGIEAIALQQPVASDLRKVVSDIFISIELERIADYAVSIAKIVLDLESEPEEQFVQAISDMAEKCRSMLALVKQAYEKEDEQLARKVAAMDDEIDSTQHKLSELMFQEICNKPENKKTFTYLLWVIHNLERVGDRITNIAERIVYIKTNEVPDLNR